MGKQDYLFKRKGSRFWQFRLITPAWGEQPRRTKYVSTCLETYAEALTWALPHVLEHLRMVADRKKFVPLQYVDALHEEASWRETYGPEIELVFANEMMPDASMSTPDGGRLECSVDGKTIAIFNSEGKFVGSRRNERLHIGTNYIGKDRHHRTIREIEARVRQNNPELASNLDERVFKSWIKHEQVTADIEKEARRAYKTLKQVAPNRDFSTFRPEDVHATVDLWRYDRRNGSGTMEKKRTLLRGIVNHAMDNARKNNFPEIKKNVFLGDYVPQGIKGARPQPRPFHPEDHALIMRDLHSWPIDQQRLYVLGRLLGLRAEECWRILEEEIIEGVRCVVVRGTKNDGALRKIPIPDALSPYLPVRIEGCLFEKGEAYTNKQMMIRIRALLSEAKIDHAGKTHHSLRHGLETELGRKNTHPKIVDAILGHVPDDLRGNNGDNHAVRVRKSITYRYFHGCEARTVLTALNQIDLQRNS